MQAAATELAELFNEFASVCLSQFAGFASKGAEPLAKGMFGRMTLPIFGCRTAEKLAANLFKLGSHFTIIGKVHLLKLINESGQAIEGLLMDAIGFSTADTGEHFFAKGGGLFAERGHTLGDKLLDIAPDLRPSGLGSMLSSREDLFLFSHRDEVSGEMFGHGDLEERGVEAKVFSQSDGKSIGDRGHESGGIAGQFLRQGLPLFDGTLSMPRVVGDKLCFGRPKIRFEGAELFGNLCQSSIGQEVTQSVEKRKGVGVDQGMGATFDEGEVGGGLFGEEAFVAETNQAGGDGIGLQSKVFSTELFTATPEANADID